MSEPTVRFEWGVEQDGYGGARVVRGPTSPDFPRSLVDRIVNEGIGNPVLKRRTITVGPWEDPETARPADFVELRARFAALADALDTEAAGWFGSDYLHERGEASGRRVAAYRIRRILNGGSDDDDT